ncbi:MAG: DUF885 domain-containing protein [Gammaproteobacteria bacterium]|nr:DUF885 domain-containing protein [Gammaproteobacteria bacterium]
MNSAARDFDALIIEFYDVWFRFHPTEALSAGVSGYEGGLRAVDDDETGALGVWLESTIVALEELDYMALDEDRRVDLELLFRACQDEHHALLEHDWRHRDPVGFLPIRALHQLVLAPQVELKGVLEHFLERIPEYLRHARSQLATFSALIPHPWVEAALLEIAAGVKYLAELRDGLLVKKLCRDPVRTRELCDKASQSLTEYSHFLEQEIAHRAQGVASCGEERFRQRMGMCHLVKADPHRMLELVMEAFEETQEQLRNLCVDRTDSEDPARWVAQLEQREHTDGEQKLEFAREQSRRLREYIGQSDIFELPPGSRLTVEQAPGCFLPGVCVPTYVKPVPGDPDLAGIIYLNPESRTREAVIAQCIRSGWGGYHLQAVSAACSPTAGNLVRQLVTSSAMTEGWKLYGEQLLFESGYAANPEQSLIRLLERSRRLFLAALDVQVHVDGLAVDAALERLEALPGISSKLAAVDLMALTRRPTESLAAVLGWKAIGILRADREEQDPHFTLKEFHRTLLDQGPIALPLLVRRCFGEEQWDRIGKQLCLQQI